MPKPNLIETTITPEKVWPAKAGKPNGNLQVGEDRYFIPQEHLHFFREGEPYTVAYTIPYENQHMRFVRQVQAGGKWMPVEADKPLGSAAPNANSSTAPKANVATQPPRTEYGAITQKDKLIWVECCVKAMLGESGAPRPASGDETLGEIVEKATYLFDRKIQPWLEGKQPGPGDAQRAKQMGDANPPWDESVEPPGFPEGYGG